MNQQLSLFPELETKEPTTRQGRIDTIIEMLRDRVPPKDAPICVNYGGGTNSTALLIWMVANEIKPDVVLFADTGNEKPETYEYIKLFSDWLVSRGFPSVETVRYEMKKPGIRRKFLAHYNPQDWKTSALSGLAAWSVAYQNIRQVVKYTTLGEQCILFEMMPSKAYGNGACSQKWKAEVIRGALRARFPDAQYIRQFIGIHAGEKQRLLMSNGTPKQLSYGRHWDEYPLILEGIEQHHCNALIQATGLPIPPKSSCWFCPNARLSEVLELKRTHPDLFEFGCTIERQSDRHKPEGSSVKGLGRSFRWNDIDKLTPLEAAAIEAEKAGRKCSCLD